MIQRILGERYALEEKIGNGGMAEVHRAHDNLLDRTVAVKILHAAYRDDAEFIERFHREAKAAAKLSNPNIVNIYDVGVAGEDHYIVMEYVPGRSLKSKIRDEGQLKIFDATTIAKDIASGLAHAHENNLVHCDIKPHNILMTEDGHAKIADFGIARAVTESTVTYGGSVVGSVHYFSPEQAQGKSITPKSDIYSLGVVMYEMLTGRLPFTGDTAVAVALKHVEEDPIPPEVYRRDIPPMFRAIILRAMSKDPESRPPASDLIQALEAIEENLKAEQVNDPDATQILPRSDSVNLPARRAMKKPVEDAKNDSDSKPFFKSKIFMAGLAVILIIGFGAGLFLSSGKFFGGEEVTMPDVKGKQLALARQILEDAKLRVNVAETYDANVAPGEVVSQDPTPGRKVKADRLVTIYISKGGEVVEMPDLVGLSKSAATERIQKLGLKIGSVYEKDSSSEPGTILSQDPHNGSKINRGQTVDIVVSRGEKKESKPSKVKVPDVRNASLDVARSGLERQGLRVGSITYRDGNQADGTVISQSPSPDTEVSGGSDVDLVVTRHESENSSDNSSGRNNYEPEPSPEPENSGGNENYTEPVENNSGNVEPPPRESGGNKKR